MARYDVKLEPLCEVVAYVTPPIPVGPSSWGVRMVFPVIEGTVEGSRIKGKLRPVGGDYLLARADNCLELDIRGVIETDDGAIIYTHYHGISELTEEQMKQFLAGELVEGSSLYVTPRFETGHEKYQWLTHVQAVGRGGAELEGDRLKVTYSWYVMTH